MSERDTGREVKMCLIHMKVKRIWVCVECETKVTMDIEQEGHLKGNEYECLGSACLNNMNV